MSNHDGYQIVLVENRNVHCTWTAASIRCPFCSTIVTGTYWGGGGCKGAAWGWTAT